MKKQNKHFYHFQLDQPSKDEVTEEDAMYPISVPSFPLYILLAAYSSCPVLPLVTITDHQPPSKKGKYKLAEVVVSEAEG